MSALEILEQLKHLTNPERLAVIHARTPEAAENVTARVAAAFTVASQAQPRALLLRRVPLWRNRPDRHPTATATRRRL